MHYHIKTLTFSIIFRIRITGCSLCQIIVFGMIEKVSKMMK